MKFGCNRPSSFRGEVVCNCGRTTDRRRTTEPAYTISSPGAFGSGELKIPQDTLSHLLTPLKLKPEKLDAKFMSPMPGKGGGVSIRPIS